MNNPRLDVVEIIVGVMAALDKESMPMDEWLPEGDAEQAVATRLYTDVVRPTVNYTDDQIDSLPFNGYDSILKLLRVYYFEIEGVPKA